MSEEARKAADELFAHRRDDGEWSEKSEEIEVRGDKSHVVSFRLPRDEFDLVIQAADAAQESLSVFIREAIAVRLFGTPFGPTFEITSGTSGTGSLQIRSYLVASPHSEAPDSVVPDYPDRFASLA